MLRNRSEAGQLLADKLKLQKLESPVILALPRGGVPIGYEIATQLKARLDILMVRKISVPWQKELAVGAIIGSSPPEIFIDHKMQKALHISTEEINEEISQQLSLIEKRQKHYGMSGKARKLQGRSLIIVDDGIATGATVRVAITAVRKQGPCKIILAIPIASRESLNALEESVNQIICLEAPFPFHSVGAHYQDFSEVSDEDVISLLAQAHRSGLQEKKQLRHDNPSVTS